MKHFIFAVLLLASTAHAGTIDGVVTDAAGAGLPGTAVTLTCTHARPRTANTDSQGRFAFVAVAPGPCTVTAVLPGFTPATVRAQVAGQAVHLSIALHYAAVMETITVTAAGPVIDRVQYASIREHDFTNTRKQKTTTFAIDVDTASYANVRRFLNGGEKPPADAVRIEEMINYFRYDDPAPRDGAPFSVTSEVAGCPWNAKNRLVRIALQAANLEQWKMAPNNLVFLLDVSGSMDAAARLPLIQSAFRLLVEQLRAEDRVAIVVYAGAAGLVLPPTSGADKQTILAALDRLHAGGSTAGGKGIELAYEVARANFLRDGNNRVILATDGDFNVGVSSLAELERLIEKKRKSGVFLSVLGVGDDNYQDAAMELLADKGNGNFSYLDSMREAEKVFRRELTGTLVTVAKDVKVQVEFDPAHVASYRQIGYENRALDDKDFDDDTKDAGDLGAGQHVTALYEIVPASDAHGTLGAIRVRYKAPAGEKSTPLATTIVDEGKSAWDASPDMQLAVAVAEFAMLLRDSPHKGTSTWDDVAQLAKVAMGADLDGTREELAQLVEVARRDR
ncbi:MAG TPA: von Willebrand factor type A domain-containing protein [Thermoanaerobaculia bacterium]|nr:von Willebrand factor type A domain-containing protein [Thermoanaerobaculia bacterium]